MDQMRPSWGGGLHDTRAAQIAVACGGASCFWASLSWSFWSVFDQIIAQSNSIYAAAEIFQLDPSLYGWLWSIILSYRKLSKVLLTSTTSGY